MGQTSITVLTPSIRPEGLEIVKTALDRQSFEDFEWLVVSPKDYGFGKWIKEPDKLSYDIWALNKAYNEGIRNAKGSLIISWQDYTFADPDALERYYFHYTKEPQTLVTGVGNKYEAVYPKLGPMVWKDPRENSNNGTYYPCYFNDIEFNFCAVPKEAFYAVGGFDEDMDRVFGLDAYSVVHRLSLVGGWDFKIDQTIKSYSLTHGRPTGWDDNNAINGPYEEKRRQYSQNAVLSYLIRS